MQRTLALVLTRIAKPMNRLAACGDPRAEKGQRTDDQGRNDRVVQIGPEGLAASADVMGRPQDRVPHRGYRWRRLSGSVDRPDRGRDCSGSILGISMTADEYLDIATRIRGVSTLQP